MIEVILVMGGVKNILRDWIINMSEESKSDRQKAVDTIAVIMKKMSKKMENDIYDSLIYGTSVSNPIKFDYEKGTVDWETHVAYVPGKIIYNPPVGGYYAFNNGPILNKEHGIFPKADECECGSHKTYGTNCSADMHSTWCPLYRKV